MKRANSIRTHSLLAALLLTVGSEASAQWPVPDHVPFVLKGGGYFDTVSGEILPNPGILVSEGRIAAIGDLSEEQNQFERINLSPQDTILPGFIDLHAHYNYDLVDSGRVEEVEFTGQIFLANGVTSTWSAGEYLPQRVIDQRDRVDRGDSPGPRIFASGPYMGGFRCEYAIRTAEDDCIGWPNDITEAEIRAEVDRWAERGVISIKIKQATPWETGILIDQAHQRGMTTAGHLSNYEWEYDVDPRQAIPMGLDRLEHNITLGNGGPRSSELEEMIELMLRHEVYFDANLQMYGGVNLREDLPDLVWTDESRFFTPYARKLLAERGAPKPESSREEFAQRLLELKQFYRAGGAHLLIIGTDEPVYTSLLAGFAYHRELASMVHAGIAPADVLRAATINGARALKLDDRVGSITQGLLADLVIVRGNPLHDIKKTRDPVMVIKNGDVEIPAELLRSAEDRIGPSSTDDRSQWSLEVEPFNRTPGSE